MRLNLPLSANFLDSPRACAFAVRRYLLVVALFSMFVALPFMGSRGLYSSTEGRYAESAREMLETGNVIEPLLDYQPHLTKPVLTYWAIIGGIRLLGQNEWGVRLYSALAFIATSVLVALLGSILWRRKTGLIAGLIYASSPFTIGAAGIVSTDSLFTLWVVLTFVCYLLACRTPEPVWKRRYVRVLWLAVALGFLTKSIAMGLPFVVLLGWHLWQRPDVPFFDRLALICCAVVAGHWFAYEALMRPGFFVFLWQEQVASRFTDDSLHRNSSWYGGFVVYLPMMVFGPGLWSFLVAIRARRGARSGWRTVWNRSLGVSPSIGQISSGRGPGLGGSILLLGWAILPLAVLFLAKSRLGLYLLPFYPPVCVIFARLLERAERSALRLSTTAATALSMGCLWIIVKAIFPFVPVKVDMRALADLAKDYANEPAAQLVANRDEKLYGLQFYLSRGIEKIELKNWLENSPEELTAKIEGIRKLGEGPTVIVIDHTEREALAKQLTLAQIPFVTMESPYWAVFRLPATTITRG